MRSSRAVAWPPARSRCRCSLVEFSSPESIRRQYPDGIRELANGGTWNTIVGLPTDDSEMALMLARMLVGRGAYDPEEARKAHVYWLNSGLFDPSLTVATAGPADPPCPYSGHERGKLPVPGEHEKHEGFGMKKVFRPEQSIRWMREHARRRLLHALFEGV
jgi:hypothetical protein